MMNFRRLLYLARIRGVGMQAGVEIWKAAAFLVENFAIREAERKNRLLSEILPRSRVIQHECQTGNGRRIAHTTSGMSHCVLIGMVD
jgi:hypothetical protein